jgi:hypothetical protein
MGRKSPLLRQRGSAGAGVIWAIKNALDLLNSSDRFSVVTSEIIPFMPREPKVLRPQEHGERE